jgi:hypothetical protein
MSFNAENLESTSARPTRRTFLIGGSVAAGSVLLSACAGQNPAEQQVRAFLRDIRDNNLKGFEDKVSRRRLLAPGQVGVGLGYAPSDIANMQRCGEPDKIETIDTLEKEPTGEEIKVTKGIAYWKEKCYRLLTGQSTDRTEVKLEWVSGQPKVKSFQR